MSRKKSASSRRGTSKNNRNRNSNKSGKNSGFVSKAAAGGWFTRIADSSDAVPLTDYAPYTPGIMMVIMIGLILVLDMFTTVMADSQYYDFRNVFRVFDYISIAVGLMFLIYKAVKKELSFCLRDAFFAGFMLCIIISTCINGLTSEAAFGMPIRFIGIFNMFAFFIIYMKVSGYISRVSFRHTIMLGFLAVADVVALTALYDRYISPIAAYQNKDGMSALFAQFNHYGYFLAMVIMTSIGYFIYERGWKSYAGAASALLNLFVLVPNDTLGAELAVGIITIGLILAVLIYDRSDRITVRKTLAMAGVFSVCIAGALILSQSLRETATGLISDAGHILSGNTTGEEGTGRLQLWQTTIGYIKERPFFGYGCEGITDRLLEEVGIGDAHCEILTFTAYYGIPGALLYLSGVIAAAVSYFKHRANLPSYCKIAFLGAGAYFLSSFVGVPMFYTAPFYYVFMGMAVNE